VGRPLAPRWGEWATCPSPGDRCGLPGPTSAVAAGRSLEGGDRASVAIPGREVDAAAAFEKPQAAVNSAGARRARVGMIRSSRRGSGTGPPARRCAGGGVPARTGRDRGRPSRQGIFIVALADSEVPCPGLRPSRRPGL